MILPQLDDFNVRDHILNHLLLLEFDFLLLLMEHLNLVFLLLKLCLAVSKLTLKLLVLFLNLIFQLSVPFIHAFVRLFYPHFFLRQLVDLLLDHLSHKVHFLRSHWALGLVPRVLNERLRRLGVESEVRSFR